MDRPFADPYADPYVVCKCLYPVNLCMSGAALSANIDPDMEQYCGAPVYAVKAGALTSEGRPHNVNVRYVRATSRT